MGVHRSKYAASDDLAVILEVPEPPMGSGSGFIPPPTIRFYKDGHMTEFFYQGNEDD
jgi:hypothetical protein